MSKAVWKYELQLDTQLQMPVGAEILTVGVQHERICLWAKVDVNAPKAPREFQIVGTGHTMDNGGNTTYIGTVMLSDGYLVFHIFEKH